VVGLIWDLSQQIIFFGLISDNSSFKMALLGRISKCLDSTDLPTDVSFLFKDEGGEETEVKAHKLILAIASEVFKRNFFGSFESESKISIEDVSEEVFKAMVDYIYNKEMDWDGHELSFLASLYYVADKYDISELREEIIASIPEHKVSDENVLDVAILAEANIHHQPLSDALYDAGAAYLLEKFKGKAGNVYKFCSENDASDITGLVVYKMLGRMEMMPKECDNCQKTPCLNGQTLTLENFVTGANVNIGGTIVKLVAVNPGNQQLFRCDRHTCCMQNAGYYPHQMYNASYKCV